MGDVSLLEIWKVTCLEAVEVGLGLPIIGTMAEVAMGLVLTLVVEVDELRLATIDSEDVDLSSA